MDTGQSLGWEHLLSWLHTNVCVRVGLQMRNCVHTHTHTWTHTHRQQTHQAGEGGRGEIERGLEIVFVPQNRFCRMLCMRRAVRSLLSKLGFGWWTNARAVSACSLKFTEPKGCVIIFRLTAAASFSGRGFSSWWGSSWVDLAAIKTLLAGWWSL